MTATAHPPLDRVNDAVLRARADLASVSQTPVWPLTAGATTQALDAVLALEAQAAELKGRLLAHADQLKTGDATGATSTANWWAHHSRLTRRETHRQMRLANALERHDATRVALAEGRLHVEQAMVIAGAVDDLPEDLNPTLVDEGEAQLIAEAAHFDAVDLKRIGERRPSPERMGHALCELLERYPTKRLPKAGGLSATVVVLMHLDTLMGGLRAAKLDTGEQISSSLARRLACEAGIIPAVLGGKSQVLDLGRKRRFHSDAQRIAKLIEQGGRCLVEGCDTPAGLAHMHHPHAWSEGGETNRDGWLICPPHHAKPTTPGTSGPDSPPARSPSTGGSEESSQVAT